MHSAPSVNYPLGDCCFFRRLAIVLWLAGAVVTVAWVAQAGEPGWHQALAGAIVCGCGVLVRWIIAAEERGTLSWTGQAWRRTAGATSEEGSLTVRLDLQHVMLLQFHAAPVGKTSWLWVELRQAPQYWGELRRAVHSRARAAKPPQPVPF